MRFLWMTRKLPIFSRGRIVGEDWSLADARSYAADLDVNILVDIIYIVASRLAVVPHLGKQPSAGLYKLFFAARTRLVRSAIPLAVFSNQRARGPI